MSEVKPPLPGRIIGYAVMVVAVAVAARVTWELLLPLIPFVVVLAVLVGIVAFVVRRW